MRSIVKLYVILSAFSVGLLVIGYIINYNVQSSDTDKIVAAFIHISISLCNLIPAFGVLIFENRKKFR